MGLLIWKVPNNSNEAELKEIPVVEGTTNAEPVDNELTLTRATEDNNTSAKETAAPQAKVSLIIAGSEKSANYEVDVKTGDTVADVLQSAETAGLTIFFKDFGGELGLFVESINGLDNDQKKNMYWTLYVNGQRASQGASSTIVKATDLVEWKFERAVEEGI